MLTVMTDEQEMASRYDSFAKLKIGSLFHFSTVSKSNFEITTRYCIVVEKRKKSCVVIELTKDNISKMLEKKLPAETVITLNEMECLNLDTSF